MKIVYSLTKEDYLAFNIYHATHSNAVRRNLLRQRYIYSTIFLIVPFVSALYGHGTLSGLLSVFVPIWLLWTVFYPKFFLDYIERQAKRYTEQHHPRQNERHAFTLNDQGIRDQTAAGDKRINWKDIERAIESENYFLFYINHQTACIVPKRAFQTSNARAAFLELMNQHKSVISPKPIYQ